MLIKLSALLLTVALPSLAIDTNFITSLNAPAPNFLERFGHDLAVNDDYIAVSGPQRLIPENFTGGVYVYDRDTRALLHTLSPGTGNASAQTGTSISISGDLLAAGAPYWSSNKGAVFIWDLTTGDLLTTVTHPAANNDDEFGISVSLNGTDLLIGAHKDEFDSDNEDERNHGTVYQYSLSSGSPSFVRTYEPAAYSMDLRFGSVVAMTDQYAIIGSPNETIADSSGDLAFGGKVFVYDKSTGTLTYTLTASNAASDAYFGFDLDVDDSDRLLVGTGQPLESTGTAYLYDLTTGTETLEIIAPDSSTPSFGRTVELGDFIFVGAFNDGAGATFVYDDAGTLLTKLTSDATVTGNNFASSMASYQGTLLVGAPNATVSGLPSAGTIFQFGVSDYAPTLIADNSSLDLTWNTVAGRTYRAYYSLTPGESWSELSGSPITATSTQTSLPSTLATKGFYYIIED